MRHLQARGIAVVRLNWAEVLDPSGQIGTGRQVLGGIAIALLPRLVQREVNHRPQRHRRGQRMFLGQCFGRRGKEFVVIPVDIDLLVDEQARSTVQRWPVQQEGESSKKVGVRRGMCHRALLGLDVFEIR